MQKCEGEIQKITVWFLRSRLLPETFASLPFAFGDQWFLLRTMVDQRGFVLGVSRDSFIGNFDIWIKVSFRSFARQFISSCVLIKNSC